VVFVSLVVPLVRAYRSPPLFVWSFPDAVRYVCRWVGKLALSTVLSVSLPPSCCVYSSDTVNSSLDNVLRDPVCLSYLEEFLFERHEAELLWFWLEAELYRDTPMKKRAAEAPRLYHKYLAEGGEAELRLLSTEARERVRDLALAGIHHMDVFCEVQDIVLDQLHEVFPGFQSRCVGLQGVVWGVG
jgi:hypothetical protein